ncbi:MFS quinate transporter [Colletotrichum truncatum]|uniref:MFS quinate transporter n=1 Tax=Colletotrichum truncatum TaxID=5467 RepID=A0ACC3ZGT9_COLTU
MVLGFPKRHDESHISHANSITKKEAKLLSTGIYGIVKGVAATVTFLYLVDRFGRRALLFVGSIMCAFSMYYVAAFSGITNSFNTSLPPNAGSNSAAAFIYIFGAGYAIGWNLPWIIASEIFPTRIRSFCLVLTTCSHWLGEFYVSYAVTYMFRTITYGTFLFFGSMTVLGGVYVYLFVPETRGVPLEDMDVLFETPGLARQKMRNYKEYRANSVVTEGLGEEGKNVDDDRRSM